jgi:hypothetical protein
MNPDLMGEPEEYWNYAEIEIKSTKCRCTPEEKRRSRGLFDSGRKAGNSISDLGGDLEGASSDKRNSLQKRNLSAKWASLKKRFSLGKWASSDKRASPNRGDASDERGVRDGSPHRSSATLHTLPPEILYPILDMVYEEENRSRDLCRCSRPKTPYYKIRKISLEHHVVNTAPLRSVCRAFHGWALENGFKGRDIEVDLSDFGRLQRKFGTNGAGVVKRLVEDFPRLDKDGVIMYLGNPGQVSNIRSVLELLRGGQGNIFSGLTLWDLDFCHREKILGMPELAFGKIPKVDPLHSSNLSDALLDIMTDISRGKYYEERVLLAELLTSLDSNSTPLSTVHVPVAIILDGDLSMPNMKGFRSLSPLTSGCRSIVFREFLYYNRTHAEEIREYVEGLLFQLRSTEDCPLKEAFQLNFDTLERANSVRMAREHVKEWGIWIQELLGPRHIEFRRVGVVSPPGWIMEAMPLGTAITQVGEMFKGLESLVITDGGNVGLTSGTLLHLLLPLSQTLSTLIYKPTWVRPHTANNPLGAQLSMDPYHVCILLRQYPRLKKLDLPSRFCHELFEENEVDFTEVAGERDWNLRLRTGWSICSYDGQGASIHLPAKLWTSGLIVVFLQSCRAWRDRYEASTKRKTFWNIKFHVEVWESWFELGGHDHQVAFMPLAYPPCAMLKDCDEGWHEEGLYEEKEGWMIMHMLSGTVNF